MSDTASGHADTILEISRLNKRYGNFHAVSDVSLSIRRGEFFMIVGPSGCGKSTLIRMLAGLEKQSSGRIQVNRQANSGRPENAMVFQGDSVFPWMTVWENAAFGLKMRNRPEAEIRDVVGHFLAKTGLTRFANAYPHQLSGGMRQRVSVARAFANDPDILLMDEPFSALDAQNKFLLQEELLRIWEETRKTVIFITHSVDEAVMLGDRIMIMTANPGTKKEIVNVDLPRPRDLMELQMNPEYGTLVHDIWSSLRHEVNRARELNAMEA
ncbi:ABC transporter ATP-binding protein [Pseudochelatococcus sp. B33]